MPNIIQAEFFHVGGKDATLSSIRRECAERAMSDVADILSGSEPSFGIKTAVRFYDTNNLVMPHAVAWSAYDNLLISYAHTLGSGTLSKFKRWWISRKYRSALRKNIKQRDVMPRVVFHALSQAIRAKQKVLIERSDRTFRPLRHNEEHDLLEATAKAKGVWVFMFGPHALDADKIEVIARIM